MSDANMATMGDAGKAMPVPRGQYSDTATYEYLDFVYKDGASYIAKKLTIGNPPAENNEYWQLFARGGTLTENSDVSNTTVTFSPAGNRANIFSKESLKTIMGKISKMYSDLKTVAFSGKYTDLEGRVTITNNDLANIPGTAWDAVRGAQIRRDVDKLNSDLNVDYINASGKTIYDIVCENASRKIFAFFTDNSVSDSPIKNETWGYTYVAIPIQVNQYMVHAYRAYSASVSYQRFLTVGSGWSDLHWFRFDGQAIT